MDFLPPVSNRSSIKSTIGSGTAVATILLFAYATIQSGHESSEAKLGPACKQATDDPRAYRLYLKGREFTTGTEREMDRAITCFQEAIDLEPRYALAYAGLAHAYTTQSYLRGSERDERVELARSAARKALAIDPNLAEAYTASGMIKMMFDRIGKARRPTSNGASP